jgi:hypothetical protein
VSANIAFSHSAEDRIDQRVQDRVRIRMAGKPFVMGNLDTAQYKLSPAAKPMRVKTMPDANFLCHDLRNRS